ncbi:zona pellucida sperm-binding protein 3d.2 isoform X2 [Dunckerocampus dactyliophorus]|uniref:zona pellucida sperm-binding protein 3d.2 isoform X2 n=1 Tax=Dunckerocampus dactyliophorus TaxID=161453 RepID=UPI002404DCA0|nr:zona pellucida sperm-binding protein 3d.2 isoform X2 [Dunckerocampus dactyliophorus]
MVFFLLFALLSLFAFNQGGKAPLLWSASNQTISAIVTVFPRETPTLPQPYLKLPVYVNSKLPPQEKLHFYPARGTGLEPLPGPVRERLLPARPGSRPPRPAEDSVRTLCKMDKMLVKVPKSILSGAETISHLKLGTCGANKSSNNYVYFKTELSQCGTKREIINGQMTYSNTLQYDSEMLQGPIRRTAPFSQSVACNYARYQYSYKIGYLPKMRIRQILRAMRNRANFILTPRNAQWERLSPSDQYVLGEPMYFEAEGPTMPDDMRLYVHSCYATPESSHTSSPQFAVVKNFGCMAESKYGRSRFIPHKNNAVRFSVDAFLFKEMTEQLYMHCSMSTESAFPTPTAKSCNYDTKTGRWVELYGSHWVCVCCNSNCGSAASAYTTTSSSRGWKVQPKVQLFQHHKRKSLLPSTKTGPAVMTTMTTTEAVRTSTTPNPEAMVEEEDLTDLKWPFGGTGVAWVELEEEEEEKKKKKKNNKKKVKGTAVVEEDFQETQHILEELKDKTSKNSKRKKPTTTTTTVRTPPPQKMTTEVTTWLDVKGKVDDTVTEREWPFGGGRVEEEEEMVKGSAVVVEEVRQPRRTFEDIFEFEE